VSVAAAAAGRFAVRRFFAQPPDLLSAAARAYRPASSF
jgi:hypothetical protein